MARRTVVLSSCTYTLLGVECAFDSRELGLGVDRAEEDRLELCRASASTSRSIAITMAHLVHASIGEEEGRIFIWDGG